MILLNIVHSFIMHHSWKPWCVLERWGHKCLAGGSKRNSPVLSARQPNKPEQLWLYCGTSAGSELCVLMKQLRKILYALDMGKPCLYSCSVDTFLWWSPSAAADLTFFSWFYFPFPHGFSQQLLSTSCCSFHHWRTPSSSLVEGAAVM